MKRHHISAIIFTFCASILMFSGCATIKTSEEVKRGEEDVITLLEKRDYDSALLLYEKNVALVQKLFRPNRHFTVASINNRAYLYSLKGNYKKSVSIYKEALNATIKEFGKSHPYTFVIKNNLVLSYLGLGAYEKAVSILEEEQFHDYGTDENAKQQYIAQSNLAFLYKLNGLNKKSSALYEKATTLFQKSLDEKIGDKNPLADNKIFSTSIIFGGGNVYCGFSIGGTGPFFPIFATNGSCQGIEAYGAGWDSDPFGEGGFFGDSDCFFPCIPGGGPGPGGGTGPGEEEEPEPLDPIDINDCFASEERFNVTGEFCTDGDCHCCMTRDDGRISCTACADWNTAAESCDSFLVTPNE